MITIGKITKYQGNKGEVRVHPLTDLPERFKVLDNVYIEKDGETIEKKIEDVRFQNNKVILKFENVDNIEQAADLKNFFLKINEESILPLKKNQYYIYKIIGFNVETIDGKKLGRLKKVSPTGGADIFFVESDKKEYMIPASKEIIKNIDESGEKIIIAPIPGLLDL